MYKLFLLMIFVSLSACNSADTRDPNSQYYDIPLSTKISIVKSVNIPAHTAHIFFQGGKISTAKETNQYHPFCRFEVNKRLSKAQTIRPNQYSLKKIRSDFDVVSMPDLRFYYTKFWLYSVNDTNALYLKCGQWGSPDDVSTYLTIKQMQDTLGDSIKIELPINVSKTQ